MKNNNSAIVRKIIGRALKSDKKRNFFIITAIALTSLMITSVFSVGMSMYESFAISPFRSEGTRVHMAIASPSVAQEETLSTLDYVRHVGKNYRVGIITEPFIDIWHIDETSWRDLHIPAYVNVVGHYAAYENEIMISRAKLALLGIDDAYVGMEITLPFANLSRNEFFEADGDVAVEDKTFIISAIYTEFVSQQGMSFTPLFVSRAFAERYGRIAQENSQVHIVFRSQNRALEYAERLVYDLPIYEGQIFGTHPALEESDMGISYVAVAVGIVALFMMATGFLLIYNVLYISVSKDVRFYGLLKTLGTTPRQLKRIVNGQVLRMYIIGLPIGLIIAAALSFAVVPAMVGHIDTGTVVSFSPLIYIGSAVFTLLTAYIGAVTSARKAAKVSPIEAVRYSGEQNVISSIRSSAKGKPYRMAWRNVFRERKRALIVLVSLFLGIAVFKTVMTLVYSQDIGGSIEYWHVHDIDMSTFGEGQDDFGPVGMDRDIIEQISEMPGVVEIREDTLTLARLVYNDSIHSYTDWLLHESQSADRFQDMPREDFADNLFLGIRGIDTSLLAELTAGFDTPVDLAAFERGEIAFLDTTFLGAWGIPESVISELHTQLDIQIGEGRYPSTVKIIGMVNFMPRTGMLLALGDPVRIIMSNTYLESRFGERAVIHLGVNTEQGMDREVYRQIEEMTAGTGIGIESSYMARLAMEEAGCTIFVMGTSISGVLALIGLFNFVNVISVGLLVRKREFAILESVGMSKKQMRAMLSFEGAIYWGLTILISISAGTVAAYGLFSAIRSQDPMQYPEFIYPLFPVLLVFGFIIIICSATPKLMHHSISKMTLVERLREAE